MAAEDRGYILTFLCKIIDDNQATIRFLDTKAGFGIAILGAMVGKVLLDQDQLKACWSHGMIATGLAVVFFGLVLVTATLGYRIVFPLVNPAENVTYPDNLEPKFFIHEFGKKSRWRWFSSNKSFATLATTHEQYCQAIQAATTEKVESILGAEVLKLSFVRQLKTDRLSAFATFLVITVGLFVVLLFLSPKVAAEKQGLPTATIQQPCSKTFYFYGSQQENVGRKR